MSTAISRVARAVAALGVVKERNAAGQYVRGKIRFGLQSVKVRVSVVEESANQCRVVVQASADDVWGAGARNATRRLIETMRNLDNPGYRPDRSGIHPAALIGVIIGFVIVLLVTMRVIAWALR